MMISTEGANAFIQNFFKENPNKDYWDCTRALAKFAEIDFATAFVFTSNHLSKKLKVERI